jgi:small subunit ribosomal protein S1
VTSEAPVREEMSMEELLNESAPQNKAGSMVTATVVEITSAGVLVDVGLKVEGFIPLAEFRSAPTPPVLGDTFPAIIKRLGGVEGHPLVSWREAREKSHWGDVWKSKESGAVIEGNVVRQVKGGLIVDVGMEAFLPASQVDRRPVRDLAPYVGQKIQVIVIEMDAEKGNVVVSRRRWLEKDASKKRDETLKTLEVGKVYSGVVTSLTAFGAFVDIGGIEGLLRITDVSWGWVGKLADVLTVGQTIDVKVLKYDATTGKIGLGRKQLLPKPWDGIEGRYPLNSIHRGKVTSLTDFGAFVELESGVEGLIHQSEFSWKERNVVPKDILKIGQEVDVHILSINAEKEKMALSLKRAGENPWVEAAAQYRTGHKVKGVITHMVPLGAFVRLPSGIEGLLRTTDLSWTKTIQHPKDVLTVGQEVEAVVLEVNPSNERLALGLKQLEEDPYAKFKPGAEVTGTVSKLIDAGAFVTLESDVEGFVHISEIPAEDRLNHPSEALKEGQTITAVVVKGQGKGRRIDLSISKYERREERQLLKRYKGTAEGVSLADVTEWSPQSSPSNETTPQ